MNNFPKIAVTSENGDLIFLGKDKITYCSSEGSYTRIFTEGGKEIRVAKRLKMVLSLLADDSFVRIHHSYIVNLNFVEFFRKEDLSFVQLSTGEKIPVSKTKTAAFLQKFTRL